MGRRSSAAAAAAATAATTPDGKKRGASVLKHEILDDGRSKRELARVTQIPEVKLGEIVRGRTRPTDGEKKAIAKALGRPVAKLFAS